MIDQINEAMLLLAPLPAHCHAAQELADHMPLGRKPFEELSDAEKERVRRFAHLRLREQLGQELVDQEKEDRDHLEDEFNNLKRKDNKDWLIKLENALYMTAGKTFQSFRPVRRPGALQAGEERYFTEIEVTGDGPPAVRSCIASDESTACIEVPRLLDEGSRVIPTLHLAIDSGSIGYFASRYLQHGLGLRMTETYDIWHMVQNCLLDSVSEAGLSILRCEFIEVNKLRYGPWKKQANDSIMKSSAAEMKQAWTWRNEVLEMLFEEILDEHPHLQQAADIGDDRHVKHVWDYCTKKLQETGLGGEARSSRWWSYEETSRHQASMRWLNVMVLMFITSRSKTPTARNPLVRWVQQRFGLQERAAAADPGDGDEAHDDAGEDPAAAPADGGDYTDGIGGRVSLAKGRAEARKKNTAGGARIYALNLLLNDFKVRLWKGMVCIPQPVEKFFNDGITACKSRWGFRDFYADLVAGKFSDMAKLVLTHFCSEALGISSETAGRQPLPRTPFEDDVDRKIASRLWTMACALAGNMGCLHLLHRAPPLAFHGLGSLTNGDDRASALARLKAA